MMRLEFLLLLQGCTPQAAAVGGLRSRRRAGQMNGAGVSPTGDWKFSEEPCRLQEEEEGFGWGGGGRCMCL